MGRGTPPPASIVQMCQSPSSVSESNAIWRPSGDHAGEHFQLPGPCVSRCASDPSDAAVQISKASPDRDEQKVNRRPSGENCGLPSKADDGATGLTARPG